MAKPKITKAERARRALIERNVAVGDAQRERSFQNAKAANEREWHLLHQRAEQAADAAVLRWLDGRVARRTDEIEAAVWSRVYAAVLAALIEGGRARAYVDPRMFA